MRSENVTSLGVNLYSDSAPMLSGVAMVTTRGLSYQFQLFKEIINISERYDRCREVHVWSVPLPPPGARDGLQVRKQCLLILDANQF